MALGLNEIGDLSGLLSTQEEGKPLELSLTLIDEDPNQPRKNFDNESINELAESIKIRGVKTPISVRPSPTEEGRYIINHGARRVRASLLAGREVIPAFIDIDYSLEDQLVENIQRDNLTSKELADAFNNLVKAGMKNVQIAKRIGKSEAYVGQYLNLLKLPEPLNDIFESGRCSDVTVLNDLNRLYKKNPEDVTEFLRDETNDVNRSSIRDLKEYLNSKLKSGSECESSELHPVEPVESVSQTVNEEDFNDTVFDFKENNGEAGNEVKNTTDEKVKGLDAPSDVIKSSKIDQDEKESNHGHESNLMVQLEILGRPAQLLFKRPSNFGQAWVKYLDVVEGEEFEISLEQVKIVALIQNYKPLAAKDI